MVSPIHHFHMEGKFSYNGQVKLNVKANRVPRNEEHDKIFFIKSKKKCLTVV